MLGNNSRTRIINYANLFFGNFHETKNLNSRKLELPKRVPHQIKKFDFGDNVTTKNILPIVTDYAYPIKRNDLLSFYEWFEFNMDDIFAAQYEKINTLFNNIATQHNGYKFQEISELKNQYELVIDQCVRLHHKYKFYIMKSTFNSMKGGILETLTENRSKSTAQMVNKSNFVKLCNLLEYFLKLYFAVFFVMFVIFKAI